jgi:hypothetical protein
MRGQRTIHDTANPRANEAQTGLAQCLLILS